MKLWTHIFLGLMLGGMLLHTETSEAQTGASVATAAAASVEVGQELAVSILLDLQGNSSLGGYIDLTYDPAVFECLNVDNVDLFGTSGGRLESCSNTGLLRIASRPQSMSDITSFTAPRRYATVTLQARQPAEMTAIRLADSSQIFGTRGGDILIKRDDAATQQIKIEAGSSAPSQKTPLPPIPSGPGGSSVPEPSSVFLLIVGGIGGLLWFLRKR